MKSKGVRKLSIAAGETPPAEFRLFVKGWNKTERGEFLFDDQAAATVMSDFEARGVDGMVDLEHLSLDPESKNFDPDARAWFRLEVKSDGSLWAVNVRWTPDGERRLGERTQRYISPAFTVDPETKRVEKILNIAITAMPATHMTPALVAASARLSMADAPESPETADPTGADSMDVDALLSGLGMDASKLAAGLGLSGDASLQDIAAAMDAALDKIGPLAGITDDDGDEGMVPATTVDKNGKEVGPGGIKNSTMGVGADEYKAMRATLLRETGMPTVLQALSQVATWKASHLKLESEQKKIDADRAKLERAERLSLAARLVKVGAETPHTSGLAYQRLAAHLVAMPIADLRERVAQFEKLGGKPAPEPPATGSGGSPISADVSTLSARELAHCEEFKVKPETYAANKAAREAAKLRAGGSVTG
jgi:hypothetical protein